MKIRNSMHAVGMYKLLPECSNAVTSSDLCSPLTLFCWERRWFWLVLPPTPPTQHLMSRVWSQQKIVPVVFQCKPLATTVVVEFKTNYFVFRLLDKLCFPLQHCTNSYDQTESFYHIWNDTVQVGWFCVRLCAI